MIIRTKFIIFWLLIDRSRITPFFLQIFRHNIIWWKILPPLIASMIHRYAITIFEVNRNFLIPLTFMWMIVVECHHRRCCWFLISRRKHVSNYLCSSESNISFLLLGWPFCKVSFIKEYASTNYELIFTVQSWKYAWLWKLYF